MTSRISFFLCNLVAISCFFCSACKQIPTKSGLLERQVASPHVTSHQLRVLVNEYVVLASHRVESRADKILADNPDVAIRKSALLWKINGIASAFQAASRQDPFGAYLDLWVLNRQMTHLFESPKGLELFGEWQPEAIAECHFLEERLQRINDTVTSDTQHAADFVEKFATDYPLQSLYLDREPMASRYIEEIQTPSKEVIQVIAQMDSNMEALKKLTILYAEHLPKQARWQSELLLIDATQMAVVQRPLQDLTLAANAASRIADTSETVPLLLQNELQKLSSLVTQERLQVTRDVDSMRTETLSQLKGERAIILAAFQHEREEAFASLRQERLEATQDLKAELSRGLDATDKISRSRVAEVLQQAPRMIDHFFSRVLQIGIPFCLILLVAVILYHFRLSRFSRSHSSSTGTKVDSEIREKSVSSSRSGSIYRNAA